VTTIPVSGASSSRFDQKAVERASPPILFVVEI